MLHPERNKAGIHFVKPVLHLDLCGISRVLRIPGIEAWIVLQQRLHKLDPGFNLFGARHTLPRRDDVWGMYWL